MTVGLRLGDYATTPLYNIKAVVQATNISPSTLRAWERRYNVAQPERSESGYRLYSERDVAIIRWLKVQVDAGMSISQAVAWLETLVQSAKSMQDTVLPASTSNPSLHDLLVPAAGQHREHVRDFQSLQTDLTGALLAFNEEAAEWVVAEAFAMYPVERVGEELFTPVLVEIGERWQRGELSATAEHFATNYLILRLGALLRSIPNGTSGPLIWVGCAPSELHEVGALLLGVYLRRSGYRVHYLGQNLPIEGFAEEVERHQPAILLLSASTEDTARSLAKLTAQLAESLPELPLIGYGGRIFNLQPELRSQNSGIFMGPSAQAAVEHLDELLTEKPRTTARQRNS